MKKDTPEVHCEQKGKECLKKGSLFCTDCKNFLCYACKVIYHDNHNCIVLSIFLEQEKLNYGQIVDFFANKENEINNISLKNDFFVNYENLHNEKINLINSIPNDDHNLNRYNEISFNFINFLKDLGIFEKKIFDKYKETFFDRYLGNQQILDNELKKGK